MLDGLEIISLDSTIPYKDGSRSVTSGPKLLGFNAGGIRDLHENNSYDEMQTFGNVTRIATTHTDHMPTPLVVSAVTSGGLSGAHTSGTTGDYQLFVGNKYDLLWSISNIHMHSLTPQFLFSSFFCFRISATSKKANKFGHV